MAKGSRYAKRGQVNKKTVPNMNKLVLGDIEADDLLAKGLSDILRDYSRLGARLRSLDGEEHCGEGNIRLRLYYPAFRDNEVTVSDFVDAIIKYLIRFCLHRSVVYDVEKRFSGSDNYLEEIAGLFLQAKRLFKLANEASNKNGEAGELVLFLLTEWVLEAPQILAKMSLKTNPEMPVHGADGVHVRYCDVRKGLVFYLGESKVYSDVGAAILQAAKSISEEFCHKKIEHELQLVRNNIDLSGLDFFAKNELLKYLDPYEEESNRRFKVATCLVAFDFEAYSSLSQKSAGGESAFRDEARKTLASMRLDVSKAFAKFGLQGLEVEMFLLPLPSVKHFRDYFQEHIGWKPDHARSRG